MAVYVQQGKRRIALKGQLLEETNEMELAQAMGLNLCPT
jgi:hypothetical protein